MKYRLVRITAKHTLKYEDGPGSFTHVIDKSSREVVADWDFEEETEDEVVEEAKYDLHHMPGPDQGESYVLECFNEDLKCWKCVRTFYD